MFLDATGDEATRKVAGDRKAPPFIFAFFPGMRSRYLQSLLLQSVRHPPAHAHLYLAASDWFRLHFCYYFSSEACLLIASCSRSYSIHHVLLGSAFRNQGINTKTGTRQRADGFRFSKHAWPRFHRCAPHTGLLLLMLPRSDGPKQLELVHRTRTN